MRHVVAAITAGVLIVFAATDARAKKKVVEKVMTFSETAKHLRVTTSFTEIFDRKAYDELTSGIRTTLVLRIFIYRRGKDEELPVAVAVGRFNVRYDLWDETYVVTIESNLYRKKKKYKTRSDALKAVTELHNLPIAQLKSIPHGAHHFVGMVIELNPVSKALLAEMRRWLTRSSGAINVSRGASFFGSFVSVFVNPKLPEADRVLRLRSQPFYRVK